MADNWDNLRLLQVRAGSLRNKPLKLAQSLLLTLTVAHSASCPHATGSTTRFLSRA